MCDTSSISNFRTRTLGGRFQSPPRTKSDCQSANVDTVELDAARHTPDKGWSMGKALSMMALAGVAVAGATSAQAGACSQETAYQEAVVDTLETRLEKLPSEIREDSNLLDMVISRHRVQSGSLNRRDVNGNSTVEFSLNGGPRQTIRCEGHSTDIPGLERADQGQRGLQESQAEILQNWARNQ